MTLTRCKQNLPEGLNRFSVLNALEEAKHIYNLEEIDLRYLRMALGKVREEDCEEGSICGFWDGVGRLSDGLQTDTRRINRIETRIQEIGFIERSSLPNRRRWGEREDGKIVALAGINLAPLLNRAEEIIAAAQSVRNTTDKREQLRKKMVLLVRRVRALNNTEAIVAMKAVDKRLRSTEINSITRLETIIAGLTMVLEEFSELDTSRTAQTPQSGSNDRPNTNQQKLKNIRSISPNLFYAMASPALQDALRLYHAKDWKQIALACTDYALMLGIRASDWRQRCDLLGGYRTCLCLLIADRNALRDDVYNVRNAAAAFIGMAKKELREEGVLLALQSELLDYCMECEVSRQ